jgi:chorismate mutase
MSSLPLASMRKELTVIDQALLQILAQRQALVIKIGHAKFETGIEIVQEEIWRNKLADILLENKNTKLDPDFLKVVFNLIHLESIRIQNLEVAEK